MGISVFWSRSFLMSRTMLWLLFIVNLLGTIYGYIWYDAQLAKTFNEEPLWMLVFVPDSPTASLFFTLALLYMLFPPAKQTGIAAAGRSVIEGLAVVCSVKYGIWAVAMIVAGAWQGDVLNWQHYMLIASHLGMALEALLYFRFMKGGIAALTAGLSWLLLNDTIDYTYGVYPWLPQQLDDDVPAVRLFTYCLSFASFAAAVFVWRFRRKA